MRPHRRTFLKAGMGMAFGLASSRSTALAAAKADLHIASNTYPWGTFAKREGVDLALHKDALLADMVETGVNGYEPIIHGPGEFKGLGERLKRHGLEMRSLYVNSVLHDEAQAEKSMEQVMAIGQAALSVGTKIIVTNPSPIRWGGPEDKDDSQLRVQAAALEELGRQLGKIGLTLAYHNHDAELRQGAREFHHMLTATDPEHVKLCLDAHWVFRGCGDSEVAVFDALTHYHERVVELHLRQSQDGVWTEAFAMKGDIDYARIISLLNEKGIAPHLVLEQAVEDGSPNKLGVLEAHRRGRMALQEALES